MDFDMDKFINMFHVTEVNGYKMDFVDVTEQDVFNINLKDSLNGTNESMGLVKGKYVILIDVKKGKIIMSNTPMELETNMDFISNANGNILIAGLGIGLIIKQIEDNPNVKKITVLEINKYWAIELEKQLKFNKKVNVIYGDIFNYFPTEKFDCIYFDIWNSISPDNLKDMLALKKKFTKYKKNKSSFLKSWRLDDCLKLEKELKDIEKFVKLKNSERDILKDW